MRYMLLVYQDEAASNAATEAEMAESMALFNQFHQEVMASGKMETAERLHHTDTATTVRVRSGETLITDGPYAETKEQLGGIYIFQCADLDEALEIAARVPTVLSGAIEVRPIFEGPS